MKIQIYIREEDKNLKFTIPTGFLFSKLGMYLASKMMASSARKEYEKKAAALWKNGDLDDVISLDDMQAAEKLSPPITDEQARELLTALKNARYLMGGLPLASIDTADGVKVRVDL
ncbi:MAG: hypothetical protein IJA83_11240 [Clostridia bacterium]|nr:hypothetical protein [Clostridia bacterium]